MFLDTKNSDNVKLEHYPKNDGDEYPDLELDEDGLLPDPVNNPQRFSQWRLQWQATDGQQHAMDFDNPERAESEGEWLMRKAMIRGEFIVWRRYEEVFFNAESEPEMESIRKIARDTAKIGEID